MSVIYHVHLSEPEQHCLRQVISTGRSAASTLTHARILLKTDRSPGVRCLPDRQVADSASSVGSALLNTKRWSRSPSFGRQSEIELPMSSIGDLPPRVLESN